MDYQLVDSGHLRKLERFGKVLLIRPSSLCLWKPMQPASLWKSAQAEYSPEKGWIKYGGVPDQWSLLATEGLRLELKLLANGQIGFFPEHAQYMPRIQEEIRLLTKKLPERRVKVLNLFAYTGMATCAALLEGATVTHVDTAAWALQKTKENAALNALDSGFLRLIKEDALEFMKKEIRRKNQYDLVIADPPMFSRPAKQKTWKLEEMLPRFVRDLLCLLSEQDGFLALTNHQMQHPPLVMANLLRDAALEEGRHFSLEQHALEIPEQNSDRALPAGNLVFLKTGISDQ